MSVETVRRVDSVLGVMLLRCTWCVVFIRLLL